ncbi:MAG: hypothetical protein IKN64_04750 [Desulfovibrio sp.]|nr:hypothetical protein [Desulfovibrio sp.]
MPTETHHTTRPGRRLKSLCLPLLCFLLGIGCMYLIQAQNRIPSLAPNAGFQSVAMLQPLAKAPDLHDASNGLLRTVYGELEALPNIPQSREELSLGQMLARWGSADMAIAEPSVRRSVDTVAQTPPRHPSRSLVPPEKSGIEERTLPEPREKAKEEPLANIFSQGTLGQMTQLRAELEQLKLQVSIEETRSRLQQLRSANQVAAPAPRRLPSLDYPPIGMPEGFAPKPSLRLLSIQSVNGRYSATIGTSQGTRIVRVNDTIANGHVVSISRSCVVINRGHGNETLTIQD